LHNDVGVLSQKAMQRYQKLTEFRFLRVLVCHLILLFCENKFLLLNITC
jgi:hypothetical protein